MAIASYVRSIILFGCLSWTDLPSSYAMAMASRCIHLCKGVGASVHRHMLSHARRPLCYRCYHPSLNLRKRNVTSANNNFGDTNSKAMSSSTRNFGIVAALTSNGVIGINGSLPWTVPIPQDRDHFVNLTRNKILIVGRKTFAEEDPTGAHVRHVRVCIVVSRTMDASDLVDNKFEGDSIASPGPELKLARSFSEALNLASQFTIDEKDNEFQSEDGTINCWVAGGEGIYKEALQHDNATEVHLTHVDMTAVDLTAKNEVAYFPVEYLERYGFEEVSRVNSGLCSYALYKRQPQKE